MSHLHEKGPTGRPGPRIIEQTQKEPLQLLIMVDSTMKFCMGGHFFSNKVSGSLLVHISLVNDAFIVDCSSNTHSGLHWTCSEQEWEE